MINIENVYKAIDSNEFISADVKENIKDLITVFNSTFPNIDLSNFAKKVMDLKIEKSNKFVNKRVVKYNLNTNILEFNVDEINKGYDAKHIFMYGLLNIISSNDLQSGFNYDDKFKALNAGYTEILTNNLVGNDGDISYLDEEVISTNLVASMIGNDVLFDSYFSQDSNGFVQVLIDEGLADMDISNLLDYRFENPNEKVNVDSLIAQSFISRPRTQEQIDTFELWGSMSNEATNIKSILNNVEVKQAEVELTR